MVLSPVSTQLSHSADDASPRELLESATAALRRRRLAEVAELELAIQWAVVNGHPETDRDPLLTPGGDGTPPVREHAIPELAMARETHPASTRALIADGLDLVHRFPLTWQVVQAQLPPQACSSAISKFFATSRNDSGLP